MKKMFSVFLSVFLFLTAVSPVSASVDNAVNNLLNLLYDKSVNPYLYGAIFESFVSFDTVGNDTGYALRKDSNEFIAGEIEMYAMEYDITSEEILTHVNSFIEFFDGKDEDFELFISYMKNTGNMVMPLSFQQASLPTFQTITDYILTEFYGTIYAFNLISSINNDYYDAKGDNVLYMYEDELFIRGDAADHIKCLSNSDSYFSAYATEKISGLLSFAAGCEDEEKNNFYQFLISNGLVSMNMDDSSNKPDDTMTAIYENLASLYSGGNDYIRPFNSYTAVADEYIPKINGASNTDKRKLIISEAMSKAAEINLNNTPVSSSVVNTIISDAQFFEFAAVNALMLRNVLINNNISVSSIQQFDININYPNAGFPEGYSLRVPSNIFGSLSKYHVGKIKISCSEGDIVISREGILGSGYLTDGTFFTVTLRRGSASSIIPSMAAYAQGSPVLSLSFSFGSKITDYISREVMYYGKDVSNDKGNFVANNFYSIKTDKTREHVNDYIYDNDYISFEIGDARYIVFIEGSLVEPGSTGIIKDGNTTEETPGGEGNPAGNEDDTPADDRPEIEVSFDDIPDSHWAKDYIYAIARKGIVSGTGNNKFEPDEKITREQFTKMVLEAFELYVPGMTSKFDDVDENAWYAPYVACAAETGIVLGTGENIFGIGNYITRQDLSVLILRAAKTAGLNLTQTSSHEYNDYKQVADYALEPMLILSNAGVITGFEDNTLRGKDFATRAQAAKIICKLLEIRNQ
jgi:hypothetical protein